MPEPNAACPSRYDLTDGLVLDCKLREGHVGRHFGDVVVNGIECETAWKDDSPGAYSSPNLAPDRTAPTWRWAAGLHHYYRRLFRAAT